MLLKQKKPQYAILTATCSRRLKATRRAPPALTTYKKKKKKRKKKKKTPRVGLHEHT